MDAPKREDWGAGTAGGGCGGVGREGVVRVDRCSKFQIKIVSMSANNATSSRNKLESTCANFQVRILKTSDTN